MGFIVTLKNANNEPINALEIGEAQLDLVKKFKVDVIAFCYQTHKLKLQHDIPPTKEFCLDVAISTEQWDWLFIWGFYEHWIEEYWNEAKSKVQATTA